MCIRCRENETPGERGYCATCIFAVREEIEEGLAQLDDYLAHWAAFEAWCAARGEPAFA